MFPTQSSWSIENSLISSRILGAVHILAKLAALSTDDAGKSVLCVCTVEGWAKRTAKSSVMLWSANRVETRQVSERERHETGPIYRFLRRAPLLGAGSICSWQPCRWLNRLLACVSATPSPNRWIATSDLSLILLVSFLWPSFWPFFITGPLFFCSNCNSKNAHHQRDQTLFEIFLVGLLLLDNKREREKKV